MYFLKVCLPFGNHSLFFSSSYQIPFVLSFYSLTIILVSLYQIYNTYMYVMYIIDFNLHEKKKIHTLLIQIFVSRSFLVDNFRIIIHLLTFFQKFRHFHNVQIQESVLEIPLATEIPTSVSAMITILLIKMEAVNQVCCFHYHSPPHHHEHHHHCSSHHHRHHHHHHHHCSEAYVN